MSFNNIVVQSPTKNSNRVSSMFHPGKSRSRVHLSSLALLLEDVGQAAASAVLTVVVPGHEDTGAAGLGGALTTKTGDLAVVVDLVELENSQLDLSLLVLDLLGGGVSLLLTLLTTSQKIN